MASSALSAVLPIVVIAVFTIVVTAGRLVAAPTPSVAAPPPQIARNNWKDCSYNGEIIGCRDQQLPDGLRILWADGLRMTYVKIAPPGTFEADAKPSQIMRDLLGGLWRRELLIQGNTVLINTASGTRIVVPLRFPCQPPLKGEVGYCRY